MLIKTTKSLLIISISIVLIIVATLFSINLYYTYTYQSRVAISEGLALISSQKQAIYEFYNEHNRCPSLDDFPDKNNIHGQYTYPASFGTDLDNNCYITITINNNAKWSVQGKKLIITLQAKQPPNTPVGSWTCISDAGKYAPLACQNDIAHHH